MKVVECGGGSSVKGPVDFTGYWALGKHEGMDEFLRAAGFPWVVRKAALKFGGSAVDVIAHSGSTVRVTSLNAKGSWFREYDTEREVLQRNAEGAMCKTSSWWEGRVLRTLMEGSQLGIVESWRYMRGASMAVRTSMRPARGGPEAAMFWYFERMETLQRHVARGGRGSGSLLQQIESDQRRVARATRQDTQYIRDVLLDWPRWRSPADDFIHVAAPPAGLVRPTRTRRRSPGSGSPRTLSPVSISKSPSNDSLAALPPGMEVRSEARSNASGSRARLGEGELSASALDRVARQAAQMAMSDASAADSGASPRPQSAAADPHPQQQGVAGAPVAPTGLPPRVPPKEGEQRTYSREPTLSYPDGLEVPVESGAATAASPGRQSSPPADSVTFRTNSGPHPPAPDSDVATRGSVHQRTASVGSVGAPRSLHYKSLSADSTGRGPASTPGRASPRSATPHAPLCPSEQVMAFRLHEFVDARGIVTVVPVATPNDTSEPQLLSMSPEQAEETAAKLRELESDMLLRRQENRRGLNLCGCLVVTLASDTLPEHLRVWEMSLV